jgi:hypothetical protein
MIRPSKTPLQTVVLPDAGDYDAETVYQDHNGDLWVVMLQTCFAFMTAKQHRCVFGS